MRVRGGSSLLAVICALAASSQRRAYAQDTDVLTLRQAVTLALKNSQDVRLAQVQYNVALGEVRLDRAAFLPNLYTGAGVAYTHGFPSLPGGQAPSVFQLDYTQSIFDPVLKAQQHAAEELAKNKKIDLDRTQEDVMIQTAEAYLELAKVRHSLELTGSERSSGEKILEAIRERVQANQELPIEITRSQLALARVQEQIVKLEDREQYLEIQLRDLTGIPDSEGLQLEQSEQTFTDQLSANAASAQAEAGLVDLAMQNDHDVAEAENQRSAQEDIFHGAKLSYFPTVNLVGQYSVLSKFNNYLEFYQHFERNNVNVGVQITIPVFASKTRASIALAKSQLEEAEAALGSKRQTARLDVQQKARNVRELDAAREVARLDLQLAQETVQDEQAKFDQGRATLQEMEQARLDENNKWVAFLDADFARQQAQLTLLQATGQLAKVFR